VRRFLPLFLGWALALGPTLLHAQDQEEPSVVQLLNANVLEYEERDGIRVRKLIGNVALLQDSTYLFCDLAYQYEDSNLVDARGNVRVEMPDSVVLVADRMKYYGNTKVVELYDNIVLTQQLNQLTTDRMTYHRIPRYGKYVEGGELRDTANVLTSVVGYYYAGPKTARFSLEVKLVGDGFSLETDSLHYNTRTEVSSFVRPTFIYQADSALLYTEGGTYNAETDEAFLYDGPPYFQDSSYFLQADTLFYNDTTDTGWAHCGIHLLTRDSSLHVYGDTGAIFRDRGHVWLAKAPYAMQYDSTDTLVLFADTLFALDEPVRAGPAPPDSLLPLSPADSLLFPDSLPERKQLLAWPHVRLHSRQSQAICDSLVYNRLDSILTLLHDPVVWSDNSQITGDTIRQFITNQALDSLEVKRNAFMLTQETERYYNQVRGRDLYAHFDSNEVRTVRVAGNAESVYWAQEGERYTGENYATSLNLLATLRDNKPQIIRFYQNPTGTFRPIQEAYGAPRRLEGFKWRIDERPRDYLDTTGWNLRLPPDTLNLPAYDTLLQASRDTSRSSSADTSITPAAVLTADSTHGPEHDHPAPEFDLPEGLVAAMPTTDSTLGTYQDGLVTGILFAGDRKPTFVVAPSIKDPKQRRTLKRRAKREWKREQSLARKAERIQRRFKRKYGFDENE